MIGLGPVVHSTYDLVSNESGQIQLYYTEDQGYYRALLSGNEDVLKLTEQRLGYDPIIPQNESNVFPEISIGVAGGYANGRDLGTNVQAYKGLADVLSLSTGDLFGVAIAGTEGFDPKMSRSDNVLVVSGGLNVGFSLLPVSVARYGTESIPVGPQINLTEQWMIDICKGVGGCGNQQ